MTEGDVQEAVLTEIGPGSMSKNALLEALPDEYDDREVKLTVVDLVADGRLEEHPEFDGAFRQPPD